MGLAALLLLVLLAACRGEPAVPREDVVHLLERTTFGATPELVQRVQDRGVQAWLEEQLHPPDDLEETFLDRYPFFRRSTPDFYQAIYAASPPSGQIPVGDMRITRDVQLPPILGQMVRQRTLRAAFSPWQLREVLTDFWFNHFYVEFTKSEVVAFCLPAYERDVIRRHALGSFRDLLGAVAHSPAMLDYLDNTSSTATRPGGLNENYGRELLELHTVGLGAGYTQEDVVAVSRCFTGWTCRDERGVGDDRDLFAFRFDPRSHDRGRKTVMGLAIPAGGGEEDGEAVLDMLAARPETARFVGRKLAVRLVGEDVDEATVDRAARTFAETRGDLARVVAAILASPDFADPRHRDGRLRSPLEFAAGALRVQPPPEALVAFLRDPRMFEFRGRADRLPEEEGRDLEVDVDRIPGLVFRTCMAALGSPYDCAAPTGWPDRNETWVSTSGLYYRELLARVVAGGAKATPLPADRLVEEVVQRVLLGQASPETRAAMLAAAALGGDDRERHRLVVVAALTSPEFQYR